MNAPGDSEDICRFLATLGGNDENEDAYLETHTRRYIATIRMLPPAEVVGPRLLELGAAFHHLTVAAVVLRGYSKVQCSDLWEGEAQWLRSRVVGGLTYTFPVDNFDIEIAPWPYLDNAFDVVLCCEILEHLVSDPMCLLAETNRVLRAGGLLVLTTPNLASAKGVGCILRGESPYVYGKFERGGRPTDRHNREYTPSEISRLLAAAGFSNVSMCTDDSWWKDRRDVLRHLAVIGMPIAMRGDNILCLAHKNGAVTNRYPPEFYASEGTQAVRRSAQARRDGET